MLNKARYEIEAFSIEVGFEEGIIYTLVLNIYTS